jgi:Zn-dependent protease
MKCEICQTETFLPFTCPYCGGHFCSEHRLPENHECPQMDLARLPKEQIQSVNTQRQKPYEHTVTYAPLGKNKRRIRFSKKEIWHLTIATLLVVGVGLSYTGFPSQGHLIDYITLIVFVAIFSASFFMHEMAHKLFAQKAGYWAEFRLTLMGAMLTLLSTILTYFKIVSPGAVVVSGVADRQRMGKISIAGPITNVTLSLIFLSTAVLIPTYSSIFLLGSAFNSWIALFNLIPYSIFDGQKIFDWNKKAWAFAFGASLALTVLSYVLIS